MALIVDGVVRYTVNGDMSGRPWAVIVDAHVFAEDPGTSRAEAVADMAEIVLNAWCDTILTQQSTSSTFSRVTWVDLNDAEGTVGSITAGRDEVLPQVGSIAGEPFPGSVAALCNKQVVRRRGFRSGRMYVPGLGESQGSAGSLTGPALAALQTACANFRTQCNQDAGASVAYTANLVVVHITERDIDGNPTAGVFDNIQAMSVQQRLATQRRRQRK